MTVRLDVVVQPRSSRSEVAGLLGGALKVRVNAPPAEGKANEECVRILARFLHVPKSAVHVVTGASARKKVVEVSGIGAAELAERLGDLE